MNLLFSQAKSTREEPEGRPILNEPPRLARDGTRLIVMGHHSKEKRAVARRMRSAMTPAEAALWVRLRRNQIDGLHFRRQQVIDGFIVDFYCHAAALAIEADGAAHLAQADYDAARDQVLSLREILVLRFTNEEIFSNLDGVIEEIRRVASVRAIST